MNVWSIHKAAVSKRHLVLALLFAPFIAAAQYPDKPIRLVIGVAAGAGTDFVARTIADSMGSSMKQPLVVDNKPGALTAIATDTVAKASSDGYTLLFGNNSGMSAAPAGLLQKMTYDPVKDFVPIGLAIQVPILMLSDPKLNISTPQDMLRYLQANPDKANCASGSSTGQIYCDLYQRITGVSITKIPYKSTPEAVTALIGGQAPLMFLDSAAAFPRLKQSQVKGLAIMTHKRSLIFPDMPSASEVGLGEMPQIPGWAALYAPANLPPAIASRLNTELNMALRNPNVKKTLTDVGMEVVPGTPEDLARFHRSDIEVWRNLVRDLKLAPQG